MSDFENIIPESNKVGPDGQAIDRIYGDLYGKMKLVLKNGQVHEGKIETRSIKLKDGTLSYVHVAGNKWFDRSGLPIEKPKNLVTRK